MSGLELGRLAAFALAGLALGAASLATLRLNTRLYLGGPAWRPVALHAARLAGVAGAMVWAAMHGAGPLLAAAAGLTLARPICVPLLARAP